MLLISKSQAKKVNLVEITKLTKPSLQGVVFVRGEVNVELKIVEHHFRGTPNHRLIACGALACNETGNMAAHAALRLMDVMHPPVDPDYVVPAHQWGG